jgi:hypothetical protein
MTLAQAEDDSDPVFDAIGGASPRTCLVIYLRWSDPKLPLSAKDNPSSSCRRGQEGAGTGRSSLI